MPVDAEMRGRVGITTFAFLRLTESTARPVPGPTAGKPPGGCRAHGDHAQRRRTPISHRQGIGIGRGATQPIPPFMSGVPFGRLATDQERNHAPHSP